jgi:hypothetical protein
MPIVTLPAHFDGERICLDEPFDLETDAKLIVTILPKQESDNEHEAWLLLSGQRLEDAYGENEPEWGAEVYQKVE